MNDLLVFATLTDMLRRFALPALVLSATIALPCLHVGGHGASLSTATEKAVIVMGNDGTQHFIRTADFKTDAKDIGFLVPTPTRPQLAAGNPKLIAHVEQMTERNIAKTRAAQQSKAATAGGVGVFGGSVSILHQEKVGGYDATILKATDAGSAEAWLKANGYPVTTTTEEWLEPYVQQHWTITAFKISNPKLGVASLSPVRMSFKSSKPFYPYREPLQNSATAPKRTLALYVLGDTTFKAFKNGNDWLQPVWEGKLSDDERKTIAGVLWDVGLEPSHLTSFLDTSSPRNGDHDLYFAAQPKPYPIIPVIAGAGFLAVLLIALKRAQTRKPAR